MAGKKELIRGISLKTNYEYKQDDISNVLDALVETMEEYLLLGEKIYVKNFGKFQVRKYKEKLMNNPKTKEKVRIPIKLRIRFAEAKKFKNKLNK